MTTNDLYQKFLAENCNKLEVNKLLREASKRVKIELIQSSISANGASLNLLSSQTGKGGERLWFECPLCLRRCGVLYENPINQMLACRKCLKIKYLSNVHQRTFKSIS